MSFLTFAPAVIDTAPLNAEALKATLGTGKTLVLAAASQVLAIVTYWVASKLLAPERALFRRALLAYIAFLGVAVIAAILFAVGFVLFGRSMSDWRAEFFAIGAGLLVLTLLVAVPMKVYEIGVFRSLGFLMVAGILSFGLNVGLQLAVLGRERTLDTTPVKEWVSQKLQKPPPVSREARLEELRAREGELARRYQQLTIRHNHLPVGNRQAENDYLRDRAAYEKDVEKFRADAAALDAELLNDGAPK